MYVTESMISKYETGATEPKIDMLLRLARFFGVDPNYLLGWEENTKLTESEFLEILEKHGRLIFREMKR